MTENRKEEDTVAIVLGKLAISCMTILLGGLITMYAWNGAIPEVFNLKHLTYWQAASLFLLSDALFNKSRR